MAISSRADRARLTLLSTVGAGALASLIVTISVTRAGSIAGVILPDGPLGLWRAAHDGRWGWSVVSLIAITVMAMAFVHLFTLAQQGVADVRHVAYAAAIWTAPMLIAQPILSLDAFSYLAQGQMVVLDLDPYISGPMLFGPGPLLDAVAPLWRTTPAPYGPLSLTVLGWFAEGTGAQTVAFVLLLRLLVLGSVALCAVAAYRLARPGRQAVAVALVAANPVTILHLVGGVHLDALIAALAAVALLAVRRRWWWLAAFAAALAFAVKLPGLVLIGFVLLARFRAPEPRRVEGTLGVLAVATATTLACAATVPDGWGWIAALDVPGIVQLWYTVPSLLAGVGYLATHAVGADPTFGQTLSVARLACTAAGALVIAGLLVKASDAVKPRRQSGALVGAALLVVALAAPVIHAWYLAWGLVLLAACTTAMAQRWLVLASVAICFSALPDPLARSHGGITLTLIFLAAAVVATGWWLFVGPGRGRTAPALPAWVKRVIEPASPAAR